VTFYNHKKNDIINEEFSCQFVGKSTYILLSFHGDFEIENGGVCPEMALQRKIRNDKQLDLNF